MGLQDGCRGPKPEIISWMMFWLTTVYYVEYAWSPAYFFFWKNSKRFTIILIRQENNKNTHIHYSQALAYVIIFTLLYPCSCLMSLFSLYYTLAHMPTPSIVSLDLLGNIHTRPCLRLRKRMGESLHMEMVLVFWRTISLNLHPKSLLAMD